MKVRLIIIGGQVGGGEGEHDKGALEEAREALTQKRQGGWREDGQRGVMVISEQAIGKKYIDDAVF